MVPTVVMSVGLNNEGHLPETRDKPRYAWPWFVFGAVVLAIALAVAWMSKEVERTRRIRDASAPAPQADHSVPDGSRR